MSRFITCGLMLMVSILPGWGSAENPVEAGAVRWQRNFDEASDMSRESGKPMFVLFQEIPGCAGCQAFGSTVLSEPLLVEAIEDEFIPVLVYNNRAGGQDAALLKRFGEPAWNYQVVRFMDADGRDLIPRRDRVWSVYGIAARSIAALEAAKRPVPKYLAVLAMEQDSANLRQCAFSMYCFWTGEMRLGQIEGVVETEAGWLNGHEVTRVTFNEKVISLRELKKQATLVKCSNGFYSDEKVQSDYRMAKSGDQKKQISGWSALHKVPDLTPMQRTKINAFAPTQREKALEWLSPRQLAVLEAK